jgi:hypothetical protein
MRSNPYRLTLAWVGFGLAAVGLFFLLLGALAGQDALASGVVMTGIGSTLLGLGCVGIIGWLVVAAIQWVPTRAKPRDARADAEYEEFKRRERDPNA